MIFIKNKNSYKKYGLIVLVFGLGAVTSGGAGWLIKKINLAQMLQPTLDSRTIAKISDLEHVMPVVIIGSGPAGLAAGVYTARAGLPTLIIEGSKPGGLLTETTYIENWPGEPKVLGRDLMQRFIEQNKNLGVNFLADQVERVDFSSWPYQIYLSDGLVLHALTVIIATGATPRRLGLPNEAQYWSHGISSCAVCDAPFFKNKSVVVVGGGDSAIEQVLQLAPHVKNVKMLVRANKLRASQAMQDKLAAITNAEVLFNTQITNIIGNQNEVTSIEVLQAGSKQALKIDGIFLAIGHDPASQIFKNQLQMTPDQYVVLKPNTQKTSKVGVFAAGEVVDHVYRQAGVAAGDGIKAALEAIGFLQDIGCNSSFLSRIQAQIFTPSAHKRAKIASIQTVADLDAIVLNSKLPIVLDFYTDYCSACLHMLPAYEAVASKLADRMNFVKVDADLSYELVRKLNVKRVPTFVIYKNGQLVASHQDALTKNEMLDLFTTYLD